MDDKRNSDEMIRATIARFYAQIKGKKDSDPDTRYRSWEWCHRFFLKNKDTESDEIKDQMALHLAFYLASWGMYRGSSFLLQRDYKAHKEVVDVILKEKYEPLWDYSPYCDDDTITAAAELIFGKDGLYYTIKTAYGLKDGKEKAAGKGTEKTDGDSGDIATDTLVTKILMGTFGCIPAFDRYLKQGIADKFPRQGGGNTVEGYTITQKIDNPKTPCGKNTFIGLSRFVRSHPAAFSIGNAGYPPMKCLDMYLWETGYEHDLCDVLNGENTTEAAKKAAREKAKKLGFGKNGDTYDVIAKEIKEAIGLP